MKITKAMRIIARQYLDASDKYTSDKMRITRDGWICAYKSADKFVYTDAIWRPKQQFTVAHMGDILADIRQTVAQTVQA